MIDAGPPNGDLQIQVAWSNRSRMKIGQEIHLRYQKDQEAKEDSFQREVSIQHMMVVQG